jgi:predicted Fe-Mo cluster-binding NifX family protein
VNLRIGIPSDDQTTIAPCFCRAKGFLVFEVSHSLIRSAIYRLRPGTDKDCRRKTPASAGDLLDLLDGCSVVIARGMGAHTHERATSSGIDVALTETDEACAAAALFIAGSLPERIEQGCGHPSRTLCAL